MSRQLVDSVPVTRRFSRHLAVGMGTSVEYHMSYIRLGSITRYVYKKNNNNKKLPLFCAYQKLRHDSGMASGPSSHRCIRPSIPPHPPPLVMDARGCPRCPSYYYLCTYERVNADSLLHTTDGELISAYRVHNWAWTTNGLQMRRLLSRPFAQNGTSRGTGSGLSSSRTFIPY